MSAQYLKLIIVLVLLEVNTAFCDSSPEVTTAQGVVVGKYVETEGKRKIASFEGIPFAKPPVGDLRFEAPVPPDPWKGKLDATRPPPACIQYHILSVTHGKISGQEDCLYLNVYTPKLPGKDKSKLLDVLAFIHGGAFIIGKGTDHGPNKLLDRDVILVTLNYRLGPIGFLSTEDSVVPGNNGLKDQALALKWIQKNIEAFGGNPKSVTMGGLSAGGASCSWQLLSPLSKGLFKGALCMSGAATNPWPLTENSNEKAKIIAADLDCPTDNSLDMIKCLKEKPAEGIVKNVKKFVKKDIYPFTPFGPVIEPPSPNAFVSDSPITIIKEKKGSDVPVVFSYALEEGAVFLGDPAALNDIKYNYENVVDHMLDYNFTLSSDRRANVRKEIREYYKIENEPDNSLHYSKLVGDRLFVAGISKIAKLSAAHYTSPVYVYRFCYRGKTGLLDYIPFMFCSGCTVDKDLAKLPTHADDVFYTLGLGTMPITQDERDRQLVKEMQDMWISFIADGKLGENWQSVKEQLPKIVFTDIKGPGDFRLTVEDELGEETFWDSLGLNENIESPRGAHEEL